MLGLAAVVVGAAVVYPLNVPEAAPVGIVYALVNVIAVPFLI